MKTLLKIVPLLTLWCIAGSAQGQNGPPPSRGATQFGIGPSMMNGKEFGDEAGFGINMELGWLQDHQAIDIVLGLKGSYLDGVGSTNYDVDIMDISLFGRALMPIGADAIKLYGEGQLGFGNLSIGGRSRASARVGGREFSVNNDIDSDAWTFGWGLGFGIQLDFTPNVALRVGYELKSYGDVEALGFKMDPGFLHGGSAALIFKF